MSDNQDSATFSCDKVLDFICAQFGEEDDSERCKAVRKHLEECPDCAAYCDSIDKMVALYRAASPSFPASARRHLLETLGITEK